jgi:hypothetical protein
MLHIAIYGALIADSYFAWQKYDDKLMRWCFWVSIIALASWIWQFSAETLLGIPNSMQTFSLYVVQVLRLIILILLVIAGVRIFKR